MTTGEVNHTREELREQIMEAMKRGDVGRAVRLHLQLVDFELARIRADIEEVRREKGHA